jgi:hypothetical protein
LGTKSSHAVIARKLGLDVPYVSVVSTGPDNAGEVTNVSASERARNDGRLVQAEDYQKDAIVAFAGIAANRRSHPAVVDEAAQEGDNQNANDAIYRVVCLNAGRPLPDWEGSREVDKEDLDAMMAESGRLFAATIALVNEHWQAIARVAKALERHDRIDQAEIDRLMAIARAGLG